MLRAARADRRAGRDAAAPDGRQPWAGVQRRLRALLPPDLLGQGRRRSTWPRGSWARRPLASCWPPAPSVDRVPAASTSPPLPPFMVKGKAEPVAAASIGPLLARAGPEAVTDDGGDPARRARRGDGRAVPRPRRRPAAQGPVSSSSSASPASASRGWWLSCARSRAMSTCCARRARSTSRRRRTTRSARCCGTCCGSAPRRRPAALARLRLQHRVEGNAPGLTPWLPLVGIPLDLAFPATPETERLDARFRKARVEEVTAELLALALPTPTLLVFDEAHLMDDASADLLRALVAGIADRPWLVVTTRHDDDPGGFAAEPGAGHRAAARTAGRRGRPRPGHRPHRAVAAAAARARPAGRAVAAATRCSCAGWCRPRGSPARWRACPTRWRTWSPARSTG